MSKPARRSRQRRSGSSLMSTRTSRLARGASTSDQRVLRPVRSRARQPRPGSAAAAHRRSAPASTRPTRSTLAAAAPVVAIPPFAVGSSRVAAPRAMRAAQRAMPLLGDQSAVLDRPRGAAQGVSQPPGAPAAAPTAGRYRSQPPPRVLRPHAATAQPARPRVTRATSSCTTARDLTQSHSVDRALAATAERAAVCQRRRSAQGLPSSRQTYLF